MAALLARAEHEATAWSSGEDDAGARRFALARISTAAGSVRLSRLDRVWAKLAGVAARWPAVVVALGGVREEDGTRPVVLAHDALPRGRRISAAPSVHGAPEVLHITLLREEEANAEAVLERLKTLAEPADARRAPRPTPATTAAAARSRRAPRA